MHTATVTSSRSFNNQKKLLLAVDFGTTYSGIGWVTSRNPQDQHIINEWPNIALTANKAPTTIRYESDGSHKWGFQILEEENRHEWFKLGLYPELQESTLARSYPSQTALPPSRGRDAEGLITDYLSNLRQHAHRKIEEQYGATLTTSMPTEYIITVPAIWSEKAQNTTRLCASNAGMGRKDSIHIISEPEAAGIYALKNMAGLNLNVNDTFVVCDAGGGTVDLISYTVASLKPVPKIFEASLGSGRLCGSVFLNRIFDHWLRRKFEGYLYWDEDYHAEAMKRWDSDLKKNFMGDVSKSHDIPVRGLPDNDRLNIRRGRLTITGAEMRDVIFEPVMREIVQLVGNQIAEIRAQNKDVKKVLLAGGFGSNAYLKKRVQDAVGPAIEVVKVENCDIAIVRGALIQGIAEMEPALASVRLHSRIARKHYGTLSYDQFKPGVHDPSKREMGVFQGHHRVKCYRWFVAKGSTIQESQPASFGYYMEKQTALGPPSVIEIVVYACDDPEGTGPPIHENKRAVTECVKLKADLSQFPKWSFSKERGRDGMEYYKLDFDIEMILHSANISFHLMYQGKRYHTVQTEFV